MCEADIRGRPRTDRSNLAHAGMFSKSVSPEALVSGPLKHQNTKSSSRHMLLTPPASIYFQINMQTSANGNGLSMLQKQISLNDVSSTCISGKKYLNPPIKQDTTNCTGEDKGAHIQTVSPQIH